MKPFKPMLAVSADFTKLKFPVYVSPKIDGVRCLIRGGLPVSRNLKVIPNTFIQNLLSKVDYEGFDGELVVGEPNHPNVMQATTSGVMSKEGEPDFTFYVFDLCDADPEMDYVARAEQVAERFKGSEDSSFPSSNGAVKTLPQKLIHSMQELNEYEAQMLALGYEGIMTRLPSGLYKHGRATANSQELLKVKRFSDSEAKVTGITCKYKNENEAKIDNLGHTERSTAKDGLVPLDELGSVTVRDIHSGVEFDLGSGFTQAQRESFWKQQDSLLGRIVKYKFFEVGVKDKPRFPVFLGFRDSADLCEEPLLDEKVK